MKKVKYFPEKNEDFPFFFEISRILKIFNMIFNWNIRNFWKFCKKNKIWKIFHIFFTFWDGFFMNFNFFWCSVKRRCPLLIRFLYLFMQCASKCSIIEIYRNQTKKVGLVDHLPDIGPHLPISSELLLAPEIQSNEDHVFFFNLVRQLVHRQLPHHVLQWAVLELLPSCSP